LPTSVFSSNPGMLFSFMSMDAEYSSPLFCYYGLGSYIVSAATNAWEKEHALNAATEAILADKLILRLFVYMCAHIFR
jgi:hypothetical protein